jgi:hypothetical protein
MKSKKEASLMGSAFQYWDLKVIFCMPNKTKRILLVPEISGTLHRHSWAS